MRSGARCRASSQQLGYNVCVRGRLADATGKASPTTLYGVMSISMVRPVLNSLVDTVPFTTSNEPLLGRIRCTCGRSAAQDNTISAIKALLESREQREGITSKRKG